jgi:hypothetical protein
MNTNEIDRLKKVICDAFFIEVQELETHGRASTPIKLAQYAFSYLAYQETMNKHNLKLHIGLKTENDFSIYMRRHQENLINPGYRKIISKIENQLKSL